MTTYMLGVDIGTTSVKAVLYAIDGEMIDKENIGYPLFTPNSETAEQDPEEIFNATIEAIANVGKRAAAAFRKLSFISFSSAMHSVMAIDAYHQPLTACLTWADNRSADWAKKIKEEFHGREIYKRTGTPIHPMSPLCKIAWLVYERADIAQQAKKYIGIKEFIFHRLFDRYVIDHSLASATGLLDMNNLEWDKEALSVAGITSEQLSELVPTTTFFKNCDPILALQMGIHPKTPFLIGAGDGVLSNLGVGAIGKGEVAVTIGTSGAIRTVIDQPRTDAQGRIFCYALTENHWVIGGAVNNGGVTLRWFKEQLYPDGAKSHESDAFEQIIELAKLVRPGADGLLFHPYLTGERAPLWNADVRASFIGLTLSHQQGHLARAVLEGVLYNLYAVSLVLNEHMDEPVTSIKATGGYTKSALWRQMTADVFNREVLIPEDFESSCLGACMLGLFASGQIESLEAAANTASSTHRHTPDSAAVAEYKKLLPIFINLSQLLVENYQPLAEYQKSLARRTM